MVVGTTPLGRAEGAGQLGVGDFEGIYRQYNQRVYSLCMSMTGDEAEAQDLTQEAFLHLLRKLGTFRGESAFYTWFYRLVVNVVRMQFRKKRRLNEMPLEVEAGPESDQTVVPLEVPVPDLELMGAINKVALRRALARLPQGFRTVLMLHDVEGYRHNEISQMLSCSVGASKSQLHRARHRLRKLLTRGPRFGVPRRPSCLSS